MSYQKNYYEKVNKLADFVAQTWDPKMKWMWVEADPAVDQSDTATPGLITYAMYKRTGKEEYRKLTERVLDYIHNGPRMYLDCLNHLGDSPKAKIYPKSVWVDSVMMFSVFTSLYAKENRDAELSEFAARQPKQYASMMFDEKEALWAHFYWVKSRKSFPRRKLFWGRGNGWVICGFPMILDNIGLEHAEAKGIIEIYRKTSEALLACMNEDYTFSTLLKYRSYRELSATALISAGWMHGGDG